MKILYFHPAYRQTVSIRTAHTYAIDYHWGNSNGHEVITYALDSADISTARNTAMETAFEQGCERILMCDSDVSVEHVQGGLAPLMESMDKYNCAAVGAPVVLRDGANRLNCTEFAGNQVIPGIVATGYLLIDVYKCYNYLSRPFFLDERNQRNTVRTKSQDIYFGERLLANKNLGIYIDCRVPTVHTAEQHYGTAEIVRQGLVLGESNKKAEGTHP